ncbi:MAG TPA: hypothetical protein VMW48_00605 [Vicinamibacterales bacterium]|nr:hypothetical protein [Vicinamibacterales bacterium]
MRCAAALACAMVGLAAVAAAQPVDPPIVEIQAHGNYVTPDVEVVTLSGLHVGEASSEAALAAARRRLEASGRFAAADVQKLSRSIDDPNDVVVMLFVEELPGASADVPRPGWLKQTAAGLQWLPVLRYDEGYGLTYGLQPAVADLVGANSRVSLPLTWGGERRAAIDVSRSFDGPIVSRVTASAGIRRTEHPAFDVIERRTGGGARLERQFGSNLRVGAAASRERVRFGDERAEVTAYTADLTLDTRLDPSFPRNAAWGRAELGRLNVAAGVRRRHRVDGHVALGLPAGSALTLSAFQLSSDGALPGYEQAMIGGGPSLRGYRVGYRVSDNAAGASASWALPLGSPLNVARTGVRLFADWAGVYQAGTNWQAAAYDRGLGAGWFAHAPGFTLGLDVARGRDQWRAHFRMGTRF